MPLECPEPVDYRRERFETRLPPDRLYSPSHFWLARDEAGAWRVGFTPFAARMLGEPVEHRFTTPIGTAVTVGQVIGWVEGFKAVTDLYCLVDGAFDGGNPELERDVALIRTDPFGRGWLYRVKGTPSPDCTDVKGYVAILDNTIDGMRGPSGGSE